MSVAGSRTPSLWFIVALAVFGLLGAGAAWAQASPLRRLAPSVRNRFSIVPACLVVAVMFGLVHTQYPLAGKLAVASFSVITCLLYEYTGSLLPGIAIHSLVDGSGFERALTGNASVVGSVYLLLAVILLARPPLRGLGRLLTRRPVFHDYSTSGVDKAEGLQLQASST